MLSTNLYNLKSGITNYGNDILFLISFLILTVLVVIAAVWLINLSVKRSREEFNKRQLFGISVVISVSGMVIRVLFSIFMKGHREEFNLIAGESGAIWHIINEGFQGYYSGGGDLYPLTLYIFSLFGSIGSWFNMTSASAGLQILIKLPLILADLGCIILLYKLSVKYFNEMAAVAISGLYALCPIFIVSSSIWGSLYSLVAFVLMLSFWFLAQKNYLGLFVAYSAALLLAKESVYLFPVIAIFVIYNYIKAIKVHRSESNTKRLSFGEWFRHKERGLILRIPLYFVCSLVMMYLISLPLILTDYKANFFIWLNNFYLSGLTDVANYGYNALNLYNLFGMNGKAFSSSGLIVLFVILFAAIVIALTCVFYFSKKNRANLVLLGSFILMTLSIFFIDFRELTALPVLSIMLLAFVLIKDKRILQVFAVYALVLCLNASAVLVSGGYLNNLGADMFASGYTGSALLSSPAGQAINIICSVLALLSYVYFVFVLMDISMNFNRKLFNGQDRNGLLPALKDWFK